MKWNHTIVKVIQLCPTLCDPMDYAVHEILQARILDWVAFPFSRGSSQPRDGTQVSCIAGRFFTSWATREAQEYWWKKIYKKYKLIILLFDSFYWEIVMLGALCMLFRHHNNPMK